MCKKIAIIGPFAPSIVLFRGPLIKELVFSGCTVITLAPDFSEKEMSILNKLGATPEKFYLNKDGVNPFQDVFSIFSLYKIFRNEKPYIIVGYHPKPAIYGPFAGWLAKVPLRIAWLGGLGYAFINENLSLKKRLVRYIQTTWMKIAFRVAHQVWLQNEDDLNLLVSLGILKSEKGVVIGGTGVDLDEWKPAPVHYSPITFTLIARLLKEKGIYEFVEAAKKIKKQYPKTRFLLIGPIDTNPSAIKKHEVERWVEEGILEWVQWTDDVKSYLAETSVYVLPSYREGVPRSTQEALAMARPVITTDAPGCRDTVIDGRNGFLIPIKDVDALVNAMEKFILNPDLISQMGQESRKLAEERFDVRKINMKILDHLSIKA